MAARDNLNGQQFYHASNHVFQPGQVLSREGAWSAKHPEAAAKIEATKSDYGNGDVYYSGTHKYAAGYPTNNDNHPVEDHLYYGDQSFMKSGESKGYGGHTYAVQPITASGRPSSKHQPDPNYTSEGMTGAYRTKGRLRVLHEVGGQPDEAAAVPRKTARNPEWSPEDPRASHLRGGA